jgi:hypothetical protein
MRYILVNDGNMQSSAGDLPDGVTPETAAENNWYLVEEVEENDKPSYDDVTERMEEYNYSFNNELKTATPLYRIVPKYNLQGSEFENSCPVCFNDFINADDKNDNVVLQALIKGSLKTANTI